MGGRPGTDGKERRILDGCDGTPRMALAVDGRWDDGGSGLSNDVLRITG